MRGTFVLILAIFGFASSGITQPFADLSVVEISKPEYVDSLGGTSFIVLVTNTGKTEATNVIVEVWDLDLSRDDAKDEWNVHGDDLWIFIENMGMAEEGTVDYDEDWSQTFTIERLKAGAKATLVVEPRDNWIYDPNCEIGVLIDKANTIQESDESNNKLGFFAGG